MATPYDRSYGATGPNVPEEHVPTSTTNTTTTNPNAPSTGAKAGASAKSAYAASENFRTGINNFFDNTIQPSAARDTSGAHAGTAGMGPGESRAQRPAHEHGNLYTKATTSPDSPANPSGNASDPTARPTHGMQGEPATMGASGTPQMTGGAGTTGTTAGGAGVGSTGTTGKRSNFRNSGAGIRV